MRIALVVLVVWVGWCAVDWLREPDKAYFTLQNRVARHLPRPLSDVWMALDWSFRIALIFLAALCVPFVWLWNRAGEPKR